MAGFDKIGTALVKLLQVIFHFQPLFACHAAFVFQLDFKVTETRINISPDAHFDTFTPPLVMMVIRASCRAIEVACGVSKCVAFIDLQHIEMVPEGVEGGGKPGCRDDVFVIQPLQHGRFAIQLIQTQRCEVMQMLCDRQIH